MPDFFARTEKLYPASKKEPRPTREIIRGRGVNAESASVLPGGQSCSLQPPVHGRRCLKLKFENQIIMEPIITRRDPTIIWDSSRNVSSKNSIANSTPRDSSTSV